MFQSKASAIIQKGQIEAKAYSEFQRMNKIQFYLDYAKNICREYIGEIINGLLSDSESRAELKKYIEPDYTVERLLDEINILFLDAPEITPQIDKVENQTEYDTAKKYLDIAISETMFFGMLGELEKQVSLCRDIAVIPIVTGKQLRFTLVAGNIALVEQRDDPLSFRRFIYFVDTMTNSITNSRVDIVNFWQLDGEYWKKYEAVISVNGQIDEGSIREINSIVFPKDMCPVVMVRDYYPSSEFWYSGNSAIVEKAMSIDLKYTDLAMAEAYNVPQLVRKGVSEEDKTIKNGRMFSHDIGESNGITGDKDVKYINPNENLKDALELIISRYKNLALKSGLSLSTITGETATSGYHLALSLTKIIQKNNSKRKYFTPAIKDLIRIMGYVYKKIGKNFRTDIEYNIDYSELKIIASGEEKEKENALALANKTKSLVDIELERNPDLAGDREKALEIVKRRLEEIRTLNEIQFSNATIFEQKLNG